MTEKQTIQNKIFEICEELAANGEKVTNRSVLVLLDGYSSVSRVQPHVKQWNLLKKQKRDSIQEGLQFSAEFMDAFVSEIERINVEAIKQEKEQTEFYQELEKEASDEMLKLNEKLTNALEKNSALLLSEQDLNNKIEVLKQTQIADKKSIEAEAAAKVHEYKRELEVAVALNAEYKNELSVCSAMIAESKALAAHLEKQSAAQQRRFDELVGENKELNAEKVDLSTQIAVRDARIAELEKISKSIESLRKEILDGQDHDWLFKVNH